MNRLKMLVCAMMLMAMCLPQTALLGRESDALEFTKDTLETVKKNVAEGKAILVDVRELVEWNAGHIRGAVFLPWRDLQSKKGDELIKDKLPKDKIIYTYCAVGYRSSRAGKVIAKSKYDVRPLKPGYDELIKAGFENEKK